MWAPRRHLCTCVHVRHAGPAASQSWAWYFLGEQDYNCEWVRMTESDSTREQERTKPSYMLGYNCPQQTH